MHLMIPLEDCGWLVDGMDGRTKREVHSVLLLFVKC